MNEIDLHTWVSAWIHFQDTWDSKGENHPLFWAAEKFFELNDRDPELCWKAILTILSRKPSTKVIGSLAAGPLEDLIQYHGPEFIDRIEEEARKNPDFRHLLGGVWESSSPAVWARIEEARGQPW